MNKTCVLLTVWIGLSIVLGFAGSPPGEVIGWGDDVAGQATGFPSYPLKNGRIVIGETPFATGQVSVAGCVITNAIAVSAGSFHSLSLCADGTVAAWGDNQAGRAIGVTTPFPHRTNGLVVVGDGILSNVVEIAAGGSFNLALNRDGTVTSWGRSVVPKALSNVVAVAAHGPNCLALKQDGTVVGWGTTPWTRSLVTPELSNVVKIAVGGGGNKRRNLALTSGGLVIAWGSETTHADLFPPPSLSNVVAIAAGYNHSLALRDDGTVVGWGFNGGGQATGIPSSPPIYVSNGPVTIRDQLLTNVVAVAAGNEYSLALKGDGTVVAWGNRRFYRDVPEGLSNVVAIAAGDGFCLAITTNKSVAERFMPKEE